MSGLIQFQLPVKGLKDGLHNYEFVIDSEFFKEFEESPIQNANVVVEMIFDKSPDMFVLDFHIKGKIQTDCDRCLSLINLPIESKNQLLIKLTQEETQNEADIVFVDSAISILDVSEYIYDFIVLSVPLKKVYDCLSENPRPCNLTMLEYLNQNQTNLIKEDNPFKEALKNWSNNN